MCGLSLLMTFHLAIRMLSSSCFLLCVVLVTLKRLLSYHDRPHTVISESPFMLSQEFKVHACGSLYKGMEHFIGKFTAVSSMIPACVKVFISIIKTIPSNSTVRECQVMDFKFSKWVFTALQTMITVLRLCSTVIAKIQTCTKFNESCSILRNILRCISSQLVWAWKFLHHFHVP